MEQNRNSKGKRRRTGEDGKLMQTKMFSLFCGEQHNETPRGVWQHCRH